MSGAKSAARCFLWLVFSVSFAAAQNWSVGYSTFTGPPPKSGTNGPNIEAAATNGTYYCVVVEYPSADDQSFVVKLNNTNASMVYNAALPELGAVGLAQPQVSAAVDAQGDCYVAGIGTITPTPGVFQSNKSHGQFVMKFGPTGSVLWATYLASSLGDAPSGMAVDSNGNVYLAGSTDGPDFPTKNAYQPAFGGGSSDAYVAVLNPSGTALVYSTFLGGSGGDSGAAIAIDTAGDVYVTGTTGSNNFPTVAPFQGTLAGTNDAFVAKLSPAGTPTYSTYLGGSGGSQGTAVAVDLSGNVHVTGAAGSADFPLVNPLQTDWQQSAFVSEFNAAGSALNYSTFWGTQTGQYPPTAITVDSLGQTYFAGSPNGGSVPLVSPIESWPLGLYPAPGFLSVINAGGSATVFSTYLIDSVAINVATDSLGNIYAAGQAGTLFPMVNAQTSLFYYPFVCQFPDLNCNEIANTPQAFALKITQVPGPVLALPASLLVNPTVVLMSSYTAQVTLANASSSGTVNVSNIEATGDFAQTNSCSPPFALAAGDSCVINLTFSPTAGGMRTGSLTITDDQPGSPQMVPLSGTGIAAQDTLVPNPLTFGPQDVSQSSSPQAVTLTNTPSGPAQTAPVPLIVTNISVSGSDFSESNNCVSPISGGAPCEIHITFTPSASGPRTGTLTIVDNATGSPQTVALSGIGVAASDFAIAPASGSPTSQTVSAGKTASFNLGLVAGASFNGTVNLACTVTPVVSSGPTCSLSHSSVPLSAGGSGSLTVTVETTAASVAGTTEYLGGSQGPPLFWIVTLFASGWFFMRRQRLALRPRVAAAVLGLGLLVGCGGGPSSSTTSSTTPGTPAGTYSATVTASEGNLSHSVALTVVVQ